MSLARPITANSARLFNDVYSAVHGPACRDARRADSAGRALGTSGILWDAYIRRVARADEQAARVLSEQLQRSGIDHHDRADATTFLQGDLIDRGSRVFYVPQRRNTLFETLPVHNVQAWAESWTAVAANEAGVAKPWDKGSTDSYTVDASLDEDLRPMMMFRSDVDELYGDAQQRAISSAAARDVYSQARQQARALEAHAKAHNAGLLGGVAGFKGYSLVGANKIPGMLDRTSTVTYGDDTSGQIDAQLRELALTIELIPEESEGTVYAPDTMMCTQRFLNRVGTHPNFEAGGTAMSMEVVRNFLQSKGITQVIIADELRNLGGTSNVDGVLFYNRTEETSLRQVLGLRPAPVATGKVDPLTEKTVFLSGFGGLYAELAGSVLLYRAQVTAS